MSSPALEKPPNLLSIILYNELINIFIPSSTLWTTLNNSIEQSGAPACLMLLKIKVESRYISGDGFNCDKNMLCESSMLSFPLYDSVISIAFDIRNVFPSCIRDNGKSSQVWMLCHKLRCSDPLCPWVPVWGDVRTTCLYVYLYYFSCSAVESSRFLMSKGTKMRSTLLFVKRLSALEQTGFGSHQFRPEKPVMFIIDSHQLYRTQDMTLKNQKTKLFFICNHFWLRISI